MIGVSGSEIMLRVQARGRGERLAGVRDRSFNESETGLRGLSHALVARSVSTEKSQIRMSLALRYVRGLGLCSPF